MSTTRQIRPGPLSKLWFRWKSSRLVPWRRKWLVGMDLSGNTFWEFTDQINVGRLRRIVEYDKKAHYADVKLAPQWIQWLRHTRPEPPSINEQELDIVRQAQMKQLAAQADARWESKASALDAPVKRTRPSPALPGTPRGRENEVQDPTAGLGDVDKTGYGVGAGADELRGEIEMQVEVQSEELDTAQTKANGGKKEGPYQGLKLGKEGEQVPESWAPKLARRR